LVELRRYERTPIDVPLEFSSRDGADRTTGRATDISLGGMFIETSAPAPFGGEIVVHVHLPGQPRPLAIPGVVRWARPKGMGVQFKLLGARETHAITALAQTLSRHTLGKER
jgi:type IV pilus assembly protein PilZ